MTRGSPHKGSVMWNLFPRHDVIMLNCYKPVWRSQTQHPVFPTKLRPLYLDCISQLKNTDILRLQHTNPGGGGGGGGLRVCKIMKRKVSYNVTAHNISLMVTRYSMCVLRKLFIDNFENWILHFVGFVNTPYMPIITIPCKHNHNKHIINRSKRHFDAIIMYLLRCEFDGL